ncbi:hypothetical protein ACH4M4_20385 [Streptomyces sp. NPDC017254]|uniref:hypothetical protein n=1 Tax=unclassified Streptomyces TaxID=2593676 RepID=UPI00378F9E50
MICPHCAAQLAVKERTGQICSRCDRRFALDPKVHGHGMHDLRIRRVVAQATDDGRLKVTVTQLWYLARTSSGAWGPRPAHGIRPAVRWLVALPVAALLILCVGLLEGVPATLSGVAAVAVLGAATFMRRTPAQRGGSRITPDEDHFRGLVRGRWPTVYQHLPTGVVDDDPHARAPRESTVGRPEAVVLCTDHAVAVFLRANDIPARLKALLVEAEPATAHDALVDVPGRLPVVVLHDASALGALLAPLLRLTHPGRVVVDGGLPVAAVRLRDGAVRRVSPVPTVDAGKLRSVAGLSEQDAAWLAQGFWSPLAAVPPRRLESVVTAAVERARAARPFDPRAIDGFLTWPAEAPKTVGDASRTKGTPAG